MTRRIQGAGGRADGRAHDVRALLKRWGQVETLRRVMCEELGATEKCLRQLTPVEDETLLTAEKHLSLARSALMQDAARCSASVREAERLNDAVTRALAALVVSEKRVIELRYRKGLSWLSIGVALGVDESYARRLERHAIERLGRMPQLRGYWAK